MDPFFKQQTIQVAMLMEALDQAYEKIRRLEALKNKREEEDADEDSVDKRRSLNIPIFKFEYPIVSVVNLGVGIFKFENRDIQMWKSRFSNLKIGIFKFEYKNDAV